MTVAVCGGCGATVEWRKNDKTKKPAPVNVDPDPKGNVTLVGLDEYHVLTKAEIHAFDEPRFDDPPEPDRFTLHFATCTQPETFRKRDKKTHRAGKRAPR